MRAIGISLVFLLIAVAAEAQGPAVQSPSEVMRTFSSSADIEALIAKAKSERKEGQAIVAEPILELSPYSANLEYRASVGPAAVHEREAEVFYVIDGTATMVTGGKLANEVRTSPENLTGTSIIGGVSRTVAKGDFILVPEKTPHWFSAIRGTIILMSLHVPRPVAAQR